MQILPLELIWFHSEHRNVETEEMLCNLRTNFSPNTESPTAFQFYHHFISTWTLSVVRMLWLEQRGCGTCWMLYTWQCFIHYFISSLNVREHSWPLFWDEKTVCNGLIAICVTAHKGQNHELKEWSIHLPACKALLLSQYLLPFKQHTQTETIKKSYTCNN